MCYSYFQYIVPVEESKPVARASHIWAKERFGWLIFVSRRALAATKMMAAHL
jgi:hypothetical protein